LSWPETRACLLTTLIFSRAQSGTDKERAEVLAQMMSSCDASSWRDVEEGQAEKRRRVSLPHASEPVDELPVGEEDTAGPEERFAAFGDYVEDAEDPPSDGDFSGHVVRWEPVNETVGTESATSRCSSESVATLQGCVLVLRVEKGNELVGRSAFAFYKLIRYICRSGMGIVEVDCCNAYFQFLSGRFRVCEELGHYVSCRDAVLEMIGKAFDVPRVEAKKLISSIGFGGSLSTWASKVMRRIPVVAEGGLVAKA
ncbi:unnamed protein product, partial [Effrenium voratum]